MIVVLRAFVSLSKWISSSSFLIQIPFLSRCLISLIGNVYGQQGYLQHEHLSLNLISSTTLNCLHWNTLPLPYCVSILIITVITMMMTKQSVNNYKEMVKTQTCHQDILLQFCICHWFFSVVIWTAFSNHVYDKYIIKKLLTVMNTIHRDALISMRSEHTTLITQGMKCTWFGSQIGWPSSGVKFINIEGHMHGTCIPDESNEYQHYSCSEAILAKFVLKLPHACTCMHIPTYVACKHMVQ